VSPRLRTKLLWIHLEPNTKINTDAIDGYMPHHFFSELEMKEFFSKYEIIKLNHFEGQSEINPSSRMASWELYASREQPDSNSHIPDKP